jgi:hypothetical protein
LIDSSVIFLARFRIKFIGQFLKLKETLYLQVLGIDHTYPILVVDLKVAKQALDDGLQGRMRDTAFILLIVELGHCLSFENRVDNVNDSFYFALDEGKVAYFLAVAGVTVHCLVDYFLRLHKEENVVPRVNVV